MKTIVSVVAAGVLFSLVVALYAFGGSSSSGTRIDYHISITDPSSDLMDITMAITPPPLRPWLHLYLRDARLENNEHRITAIHSERNGRGIPIWQTFPGMSDMKTVWTGFRRSPITVTYRINPLWMKGPDSPRSYLGPDFAYLRGMTTLFSPITRREIMSKGNSGVDRSAGRATIRFSLPANWSMISPLADNELTTTAMLHNIYFGAGQFAVTSVKHGESTFIVGVYEGLGEEQVEQYITGTPLLFSTISETLGFTPSGNTPRWAVTILPHEPIHGGAAGTGSLIADPEWYILSHEMFHWWNGETIATTADANWIKEGFTKYYEGKILYRAGLWNDDEYAYHLSKPRGTFRQADSTLALNLVHSSEMLVNNNSENASDAVYFGGMAVAWYLDTELRTSGTSLDCIWMKLDSIEEPVSTAAFLEQLAIIGGRDIADTCNEIVHGQRALPMP